MLFRVGIAVFLSIVLIGGAALVRTSDGKSAPSLLGVDKGQGNSLSSAYWPEGTGSTGNESLTQTDLISRQLMSDYLSLASRGEVSEDDIDSLVENYINLVPSISTETNVGFSELKTVPNTKANYLAYDEAMTRILKQKAVDISAPYRYSLADGSDSQMLSLAEKTSVAYQKAAESLKIVPTPQIVAGLHLKLVNNYLTTAQYMKSVASVEEDSMAALVGMMSASKSAKEGEAIVDEMIAILIKNGI